MPKGRANGKNQGGLKAIWRAYQERNRRYEEMSAAQRQEYLEENKRIAEHNAQRERIKTPTLVSGK